MPVKTKAMKQLSIWHSLKNEATRNLTFIVQLYSFIVSLRKQYTSPKISNLSDFEPIRFRTHLILNQAFWYWTRPSDTEPGHLILNQAFFHPSPLCCPSVPLLLSILRWAQPLLTRPEASLAMNQVSPSPLSPSQLTTAPTPLHR
jgi:hypothetical protein